MRHPLDIARSLEELRHPRGMRRWRAVRKLEGCANSGVLDALCLALKQDDWDGVRTAAAVALGRSGDVRVTEPLLEALALRRNSISGIRPFIVMALGDAGDLSAVPALVRIAERSGDDSTMAVTAIAQIARRNPNSGAAFQDAETVLARWVANGDAERSHELAAIRRAMRNDLPLPASGACRPAEDAPIPAESPPH